MESETEQQYLEEIAQYGQRKLLFWQLAADGRSFCGVSATVKALGLEDASVEEQVEAFIGAPLEGRFDVADKVVVRAE